jgi:hypothetical protein
MLGGGEVISYWCVAFTKLVIPDIIAIFWNQLEGLQKSIFDRRERWNVSQGIIGGGVEISKHSNSESRVKPRPWKLEP